ncbi:MULTISPECIES: hypothetical protein [unclassified Streptomyces]|uniref:hypothetical protein n=1 Tax=unclassified Streptomyces TaxID=2593676 RepID=UPI0036310063
MIHAHESGLTVRDGARIAEDVRQVRAPHSGEIHGPRTRGPVLGKPVPAAAPAIRIPPPPPTTAKTAGPGT